MKGTTQMNNNQNKIPNPETKRHTKPLNMIITFIQGFAMGVSNIIPGVSGGTIALVMGIYAKFIEILSSISKWISSFFIYLFSPVKKEKGQESLKQFKAIDWLWAIILFLGRGIAVIIASGLMKYLLENFPAQTYGAFFGLILASVIVPWEKMDRKGIKEVIAIIIGFGFLFWFSGLSAFHNTSTPPLWLLPLAGALATSAMILPGISGSFLLLMIGVHTFIISIPGKILDGQLFTFGVAIPLLLYGLGWLFGLLSFSRVLDYMLKRFHSVTMGFLIGLMLGSLRKIYPFLYLSAKEEGQGADEIPKLLFWNMPEDLTLTKYLSSTEFISILICMMLGSAMILILHYSAKSITSAKTIVEPEPTSQVEDD